jgi:hypothetical protein
MSAALSQRAVCSDIRHRRPAAVRAPRDERLHGAVCADGAAPAGGQLRVICCRSLARPAARFAQLPAPRRFGAPDVLLARCDAVTAASLRVPCGDAAGAVRRNASTRTPCRRGARVGARIRARRCCVVCDVDAGAHMSYPADAFKRQPRASLAGAPRSRVARRLSRASARLPAHAAASGRCASSRSASWPWRAPRRCCVSQKSLARGCPARAPHPVAPPPRIRAVVAALMCTARVSRPRAACARLGILRAEPRLTPRPRAPLRRVATPELLAFTAAHGQWRCAALQGCVIGAMLQRVSARRACCDASLGRARRCFKRPGCRRISARLHRAAA